MELSKQIKEARAKLGISQTQASERWGVPLPTLKAYEQGKRTPRGLAMTKLREILDAILVGKPPVPASSAAMGASATTPPAKPKEQSRRSAHPAPPRQRTPKAR